MESPVGHVEDFCLYPKTFGKQRRVLSGVMP